MLLRTTASAPCARRNGSRAVTRPTDAARRDQCEAPAPRPTIARFTKGEAAAMSASVRQPPARNALSSCFFRSSPHGRGSPCVHAALAPCRSGARARRFGLKSSQVPANLSDHAIQASASASSSTSNGVGACASSKRKPPSCRRAAGRRRETPGCSRADGKAGTPDQWHGTAATHARPRGSSPPHGDAPKPWTITPGPFCR